MARNALCWHQDSVVPNFHSSQLCCQTLANTAEGAAARPRRSEVLADMKEGISRLPDFVKGKRRGTGEGLNERLLPEGASWAECGSVGNASESGHESPTTVPGEGGSSYEDSALERTTSPQSLRSSDYSHSSTAIQASEGCGAKQRHERSIYLPDVMRQIPRTRGGLITVEGGGVEAVPIVRGDDVRVALHNEGFQSLVQLLPTAGPGCGAFAIDCTDGTRAGFLSGISFL